MEKSKTTLILKILLIIVIIGLAGLILYDFFQAKQTEKNVEDILNQLEQEIQTNIDEKSDTQETELTSKKLNTVIINNYQVYGKIQIASVGIKYPILEYNQNTLKNNICNLSNRVIDGTGNLCIAGHNTSNGTLFGKLKKVKNGDIIEVINIYGQKYSYKVYNIVKVEPENNSLLQVTENPIITLITCTNSAKQRLIVQGKLLSNSSQ